MRLTAARAKEIASDAYAELQVPVGASLEKIVSAFRALCLRHALGSESDDGDGGGDDDLPLAQRYQVDAFQRQAVAYRFLISLPLLPPSTQYQGADLLPLLRPLESRSGDLAHAQASAMLDVSITSMEQAQRMWSLPYTNYVLTVHYALRKHVVRRRYAEFQALHVALQKLLPVLPTLPAPHWGYKLPVLPADSERAQALTRYLMRVVQMLAARGLFSVDIMDFLDIDYLRVRAEEEALAVAQLTRGGGARNAFYMVHSGWLDAWKSFVATGERPPGAIGNHHLMDERLRAPKDQLQVAKHYRCINGPTWHYLFKIYGGGPVLARRSADIYSKRVIDLTTFSVLVQKIVRGFLARRRASKRLTYVLCQHPVMALAIATETRRRLLADRMAAVRNYVKIREFQTRHVAALKIQRVFRVHILRAEHKMLMAESAVPNVAENFHDIDEYFSLEEIGLIKDPQYKLAHFLVTMNKGVPIQKLRSRWKQPLWRLFTIDSIGSHLLWRSKKRVHALPLVDVTSIVTESPVSLKGSFARRRKSSIYPHAVVLTYKETDEDTGKVLSSGNELLLICESTCDCEALLFGLSALVNETTSRVANGASYVDGHGAIRKKFPHAKKLIQQAQELLERNKHGALRMNQSVLGRA